MTTQIAVRLPDDMVEFLDGQVASGRAPSRAAVVASAIEREICLARLDKTRPVVVLTRETARAVMTKVMVAPIMSSIKGLSSEVLVGSRNGLDHVCVVAVDSILTVPSQALGRAVGYLYLEQERDLAKAMVLAFDLDLPLLS